MKYLRFFLALCLISELSAQIVTTQPVSPTDQDSIIIIFDATYGSQGLLGYTGDVYAHTGLITDKSTDGKNWKYVVTPWPNGSNNSQANTAKNKMTNIGSDFWRLAIGFPRKYYVDHTTGDTVKSSDKILKLAFVFRSADGSKTGKDVGTIDGNIFINIYQKGISVSINKPAVYQSFGDPRRSPVFLHKDSSLFIQSIAVLNETDISLQEMYLDGALQTTTTNDTLEYSYVPSGQGMRLFKVIATDTSGIKDSSEFVVMVNPDIIDESRPEGIVDGINYISDTEVVLSLLAPYKDFVYVLGDFNSTDWKVDENYFMKRDIVDDGHVHWWLNISNLTAGQEYAFQYLVDGKIRVADPFTTKTLDKDDIYISQATYPNLKPYPQGKTENATAVLQTGQQEYNWQITNFDAPPQSELVIYELLIRDFLASHDYKTLIDTLNYLENLGINAIELMPVNEFEGNINWGYSSSFLFAVDKYYGPADDLKAFIDECHSRGIAVILDMVLNHQFGQSPLVQLYLDYYASDEIIMQIPNPWFNRMSPNRTFYWGADFNHESPTVKQLVDRVNSYWLTDFKVDGFRFDFTKGFTNVAGDGWAKDNSRIAILKRMADRIWSVNERAYIILEHFAQNEEEIELADHGIMLWGHPNADVSKGYYEAAMGYHDGDKSDFSWGFYKTRGWTKPNLVTKIESHDEERLMYKNLVHGNSSGNYNVKNLSTALQRMKAVASFFFTIPGPKMFWQFMELGYDVSINQREKGGTVSDNYRTEPKPILWQYFQDTNRKNLYKTFAALLKLRKENEAFRKATNVNLSVTSAIKRMSISYSGFNAIIIGNFDVIPGEIDPAFFYSGTWYDYFSGNSFSVSDTHAKIALAPGEFHIYVDQLIDFPDEDPTVTSIDELAGVPDKFELNQNYPNPFNPQTTISYQIAKTSDVKITVYNIKGQLVKSLISEKTNPGYYSVKLNASDLASGMYFYRISAGHFVKSKKMLLIK